MAPRLASVLRHLVPALDTAEDPRSEVQALIWGPRFDREHALRLLGALPPGAAEVLNATADRYDALSTRQQQRLRRLAAAAPAPSGPTMPHAAHPAH